MEETTLNNKVKSEFATILRELRMRARLKQREVASVIGVRDGTYGNVESSPNRLIRAEKVHALSRFYKLDSEQHSRLMAAYEKLPISEYSQAQRKSWDARNAARSKGKMLEAVRVVLCDLLDTIASCADAGVPVSTKCTCVTGDEFLDQDPSTCDLCRAFHALGFPDGWVNPEVAMERIAKISPKSPGERGHVANVPHVPEAKP